MTDYITKYKTLTNFTSNYLSDEGVTITSNADASTAYKATTSTGHSWASSGLVTSPLVTRTLSFNEPKTITKVTYSVGNTNSNIATVLYINGSSSFTYPAYNVSNIEIRQSVKAAVPTMPFTIASWAVTYSYQEEVIPEPLTDDDDDNDDDNDSPSDGNTDDDDPFKPGDVDDDIDINTDTDDDTSPDDPETPTEDDTDSDNDADTDDDSWEIPEVQLPYQLDWYRTTDGNTVIYKDRVIANLNALEEQIQNVIDFSPGTIPKPDIDSVVYPDVSREDFYNGNADDNQILNLKSFIDIMDLKGFPIVVKTNNKFTVTSVEYYGEDYLYHTVGNSTALTSSNKYAYLDVQENKIIVGNSVRSDTSRYKLVGVLVDNILYTKDSPQCLRPDHLSIICNQFKNSSVITDYVIPGGTYNDANKTSNYRYVKYNFPFAGVFGEKNNGSPAKVTFPLFGFGGN